DAQGPEVVFNPGRSDEVRTLKANARKVKAGDTVRLAVGGGGGFGDVSQRSREDITHDIINGFITEDFAKSHYGY
ncbi:hydantoinase B/oxoprolinase family protein, partial [Arthrobacter sp. NPDC080073]